MEQQIKSYSHLRTEAIGTQKAVRLMHEWVSSSAGAFLSYTVLLTQAVKIANEEGVIERVKELSGDWTDSLAEVCVLYETLLDLASSENGNIARVSFIPIIEERLAIIEQEAPKN